MLMGSFSQYDLLPGIGRIRTISLASEGFTDTRGFLVTPTIAGDVVVVPEHAADSDSDITITGTVGQVLTFGGGPYLWCREIKQNSTVTSVQIGYAVNTLDT